jgi:hypothetical protein
LTPDGGQFSCQNPKRRSKNTGVEGKIQQNVGNFFGTGRKRFWEMQPIYIFVKKGNWLAGRV